jgi:hypothetical protein
MRCCYPSFSSRRETSDDVTRWTIRFCTTHHTTFTKSKKALLVIGCLSGIRFPGHSPAPDTSKTNYPIRERERVWYLYVGVALNWEVRVRGIIPQVKGKLFDPGIIWLCIYRYRYWLLVIGYWLLVIGSMGWCGTCIQLSLPLKLEGKNKVENTVL